MLADYFGKEHKPYVLTPEVEEIENNRWLYAHLVNNVKDHIEVVRD